jgi:hypothetical protein
MPLRSSFLFGWLEPMSAQLIIHYRSPILGFYL